MRTSSYINYLPSTPDSDFFLVHGYNGSVDKVSKDVVAFLLRHRVPGTATHTKDEDLALRALDGAAPGDPEPGVIAGLVERGYLTEETPEEELGRVRHLLDWLHDRAVRLQIPSFLIVPTYECNLRCPYCFETSTRIALNRTENLKTVITQALIDDAFAAMDELFEQRCPAGRTVADLWRKTGVGLYGGEPLQEMCRDAVEYILAEATKRKAPVSAISNAVQLHEFRPLLGREGIRRIQVTLDGPEEAHNQSRIGPKHRETYRTILENLKVAVAQGVHIDIRIHTDWRSVDRIPQVFSDLESAELLGKKNLTTYVTPRNHWHLGERFPIYPDMAPAEVHNRLSQFPIIGQSAKVPYADLVQRKLSKYLAKGLAGLANTIEYCTANSGGMHIFDPFGDVYACWNVVGVPAERIGSYRGRSIERTQRGEEWAGRRPSHIPECSSCKYVMFHFGGCAALPVTAGKGLHSPACSGFADSFIALGSKFFATGKHVRAAAPPRGVEVRA